ncbi:HAD family hydrolase [Streptacidiphilus rugosus]|uniref:HAD family hydrolase n=1 Tax=Streptacidiphilus rugosus TaxID=405783 RepID=UPI00055FCFA5|nr:HAD hydrolase-like protein [Streptacidiphilus rugosus]
MRAHIVWDWNGTLFDDIEAVVGASNAAFAELGLPSFSVAEYREWYRVPVIDCYADRLGRMPSTEEWQRMDAVFHEHYTARRDSCGLAVGAMEILRARASQSLLSMYGHDELVPLVRSLGIESHFRRVDGRDGTSGISGKGQYLIRHLAHLGGEVDPAVVVLIGDVPDDAAAAAEAGVRSVLYTGGAGSRRELSRIGVPVADTLAEAVACAEALVA